MKLTEVVCIIIASSAPFLTSADEISSRRIQITDEDKRIAEIRKLEDQSTIAEFAKNDPSDSVSLTVMRLVDDKTLLVDIAKNSIHPEVRRRAILQIDDQATFEVIAKDDSDVDARRWAMSRMTNQVLLAEMATNDTNFVIRFSAAYMASKIRHFVRRLPNLTNILGCVVEL